MKKFLTRPSLKAAVFFTAVVGLLVSGCKKPQQDLGLDLQPKNDLLNVVQVDSLPLVMYSQPDDSIRSDNIYRSLLGAYQDPVFGVTNASIYTAVLLSSTDLNFSPDTGDLSNLIVDSVVVSYPFDHPYTHYGNGLGPMYFEVHRLTDTLDINTPYHSNYIKPEDTEDLIAPGYNLVTPDPTDSVVVGSTIQPPELRLHLNTQLGQDIINEAGQDGISASDFYQWFKGFHIEVIPQQTDLTTSSLLYLTHTNTAFTKMSVYYHNSIFPDSVLQYNFQLNSNVAHFNHYEHQYDQGDPSNQYQSIYVSQVVNHDTTTGSQKVFVQSAGGTKLVVKLPDIKKYVDSVGLALNQALLILPFSNEAQGGFSPPNRLFAFIRDSDGKLYTTPDQSIISDAFAGGYADDSVRFDYRINITYFLNQLISGAQTSRTLELIPNNSAYTGNRVILNGLHNQDPADSRSTRLQLTFTKY